MKTILLTLTLFALLFSANATLAIEAETPETLFVVLTSADAETQMMALVLATQTMNQDVAVRILLCGEAGNLALKDSESPSFKPADRSPKQLLMGLIDRGAQAEVCGIFLPNRPHLSQDDLLENVGTARPPEVAAFMRQENVRLFTF